MISNPHALAARISRHLQDVEQVVQHSEEINREAIKRDDKIYFEALALTCTAFTWAWSAFLKILPAR